MNHEETPARHIIKWEDGQDRWMMDIRPGNVSLFTTAPVDPAAVDALADQWARAYEWLSNSRSQPFNKSDREEHNR